MLDYTHCSGGGPEPRVPSSIVMSPHCSVSLSGPTNIKLSLDVNPIFHHIYEAWHLSHGNTWSASKEIMDKCIYTFPSIGKCNLIFDTVVM